MGGMGNLTPGWQLLACSSDEIGRREPWRELHSNDAPAARLDDIAAHDVVRSPVGAFDQDVWSNPTDNRVRCLFVEDHDGIDCRQRQQHFCPLVFRHDRPAVALVRPDRTIGVDGNHQRVAERARILQIPHVPGMNEIEYPVREHHDTTARLDLGRERRSLVGGAQAVTA